MKMPTWINKASLCIFGWCLYASQGFLLPKGTFVSQLLLFVLLLIGLYYFFIVNSRYKLSKYFWGLNALVVMFSIYGIYLMIGGYDPSVYYVRVGSFEYLKGVYKSLLPIYMFYAFFKEKMITEKMFYVMVGVFFLLVTGEFFQQQKEMLIAAMLDGSSVEEFTNNIGYSFLALMPLCVFLYKKPFVQYLALGYCILFLFLGMKRGAILIGLICLFWFLINNIRIANLKRKMMLFFLSVFLCCAGYQFAHWKMEESLYVQRKIEKTLEGNSSGRDRIYSEMINYYWNDANAIQYLFGSGANATLKISTHYAHNDWLEIAVNQGMLGVVLYMLYWILFARECFSRKYCPQTKLSLQLLFVIYLMRTFFSMSYGDMVIPSTFCLGYCLSQEQQDA